MGYRITNAAIWLFVIVIVIKLVTEVMSHNPCPAGYEPRYYSPDHTATEYTCEES